MATPKSFKDFVVEQISPVGNIRVKAMMGGYLFYYNDVLFGGLYGNRFLIKITPSNEQYNLIKEEPYHNAKIMYLINDLDNSDYLCTLIKNTYQDLVK